MKAAQPSLPLKKPELTTELALRELTQQTLLQQSASIAVLVNSQGDVLYLHGRTGLYLELTPGEAGTHNILKMAREGLQYNLTIALHKARLTKDIVHYPGLQIKTNGDFITVDLTVRPVVADPAAPLREPLYLVILDQAQPLDLEPAPPSVSLPADEREGSPGASTARIAALQRQLQDKDEYLQAANEELETSNEELKSSNEEMQSINEELQSTNEELETSKEELQSVNEELATVNLELQTKLADLTRANNDMNNLLAGTDIGTVFVDHQLYILRFTPTATKIINLIQSDIGRPVGHILSNLVDYGELMTDIQAVLDTLIPKEREVQTRKGEWYTMRILPYRTLDNVIEGVVLTFVDITKSKKLHEALRLNEERMRVALKASPVVVFNQDEELHYTWIYDPHTQSVIVQRLGKTDADLLSEADAARLTAIKQQVLESGTGTRQKIRTTMDGKTYFYDLTVEPLHDDTGNIIGITGASIAVAEQTFQDPLDLHAGKKCPAKDGVR